MLPSTAAPTDALFACSAESSVRLAAVPVALLATLLCLIAALPLAPPVSTPLNSKIDQRQQSTFAPNENVTAPLDGDAPIARKTVTRRLPPLLNVADCICTQVRPLPDAVGAEPAPPPSSIETTTAITSRLAP